MIGWSVTAQLRNLHGVDLHRCEVTPVGSVINGATLFGFLDLEEEKVLQNKL